ncbi:uncharacterized protein LOC132264628 [Phlebotomus argentipes]|uniref:uncharacterized protein LOC132264628 n=1 Tax=Phlebotomus argentipes TaxID=94469 RepID=UPI002892D22D|nr:uncharacterized protein LOC132264628 [Phlebotomus argentipes]
MEVERVLKLPDSGEAEVVCVKQDDAVTLRANRVALEALLEGFDLKSLSKTFLNHDIKLRTLAQLTEEDLVLLGIEDSALREAMLKDFACQPNQVPGFDEFLRALDRESCNTRTMRSVITHLHTLQDSVVSSYLKLYMENPNDIPIGDSFATAYVIQTLDEILRRAHEMDSDLVRIQEDYNRMNLPKKKSVRHLKTLGSVACVLLAGFGLYKLATSRSSLAHLTDYLQPFLDSQVAPPDW